MSNNKRLIAILSLLCLLMGSIGFSNKVYAEGAEFTVTPKYDISQTDKNLGYFSVQTEAGKTYPITIDIQNLNTKNANNFDVQLVVASTSNNGNIDYTPSNQKPTKSSQPLLTDLVGKSTNRNQRLTLGPGEAKKITFQLKIPKNGFRGTILGSVYVKRNAENKSHNKGFGINNSFAMTTPIILSQNFGNKITPILSLTKVRMESVSGVPQIVGTISNSEPTMFGKIQIDAWITQKNKTRKIYKKSAKGLAMAPRSKFKYGIDTDNQVLPKGKYTYHIKLNSGKKTFNLDSDFSVSGETRQRVNKTLINPEMVHPHWFMWGIFGILFMLVTILIAYLLGRKRGIEKDDR